LRYFSYDGSKQLDFLVERSEKMQTQSRHYECEKPVALGALYDALEKLKWKLISANSDAGILIVSEPAVHIPFVVRVCPSGPWDMEVTIELASGAFFEMGLPEQCAKRLLQTITEMIDRAIST
jgi:hypothetical protein